ncbi:MAG: hypothetical protein AB8G86_25380 [Saprospiraceae bacterium]
MKFINFSKPHLLFFGSILILWLITVVVPIKVIDLQWHDTYWVIAFYHLAIPISIIFGGIGLLYWLFRQKSMIKWMTVFHTLITILPIFTFFIINGFSSEAEADYIAADMISRSKPYFIVVLLSLFGQILFVLNLLIALFKKR